MPKWLILTALVAASSLAAPSSATAQHPAGGHKPPYYTSAVFPCANQGWQTNLYWYNWAYPWYAHYNYSHGPYANWMAGGGWATYGGNCGPNGCHTAAAAHTPAYTGYLASAPVEGTVAITLPADAKLLFNGHAAVGTGETRTFRTPPLKAGQTYTYELTAEVTRDGKVQTATEKVVVRPGEKTSVTLNIDGVRTASAK